MKKFLVSFVFLFLIIFSTSHASLVSLFRVISTEALKSAATEVGKTAVKEFMKLFNDDKEIAKKGKPQLKEEKLVKGKRIWTISPGKLNEDDLKELAKILKSIDNDIDQVIKINGSNNVVATTQSGNVNFGTYQEIIGSNSVTSINQQGGITAHTFIYSPTDHPEVPQGSLLSVSPLSYTVNPGIDEEIVMKVTNNHDYPLYKIQVKINLDSGDMPLEDILISADGRYKKIDQFERAPGDPLQKGPPRDAIRVGIFNENGRPRLSELYVRKKEGDIYKIFFIENIDSHSTKSFPVIIDKTRCTTKSKFSFSVPSSCRDAVPTYIEPGHEVHVIPKEGHYVNCESE